MAMETYSVEILIVGGGAAGMAAALAAEKKGYRKILIAERQPELGGVLLQCIHDGFGLRYFREDLTGIQYAQRFRDRIRRSCVEVWTDMMALAIHPDHTAILSGNRGVYRVSFGKCVLASGCRERTIYSQEVAGSRPAGILTCGTAQRLMNLDELDIGDDIVISGTGDVGQVMAGQLMKAGKHVITMIEKGPAPGGRKMNRERYLKALQIPVMLNSVITEIIGRGRIEGVRILHLDTGQEESIPCSTLLTAIGMIPERDLLEEGFPGGNLPDWVLTVGNCDHIHEVVDSVTTEGLKLEEVL